MTEKENLRTGLSTGSCATAASVAALLVLLGNDKPAQVSFELPRDGFRQMPVTQVQAGRDYAVASVVKDGGDDPDATNGCTIQAMVRFNNTHQDIRFFGGEGVGLVTLPGLGLEVGEPAINPVPRQMMRRNLRKYYQGGLDVTISVPGGEKIARRTFNAKVGVMGGISILGTTGIVHPFSHEAYVDAMEREMQVALAMGVGRIVLNSGKRSEVAIHEHYPQLPPQSFIHYGNFIGETIHMAHELGVHVGVDNVVGPVVVIIVGGRVPALVGVAGEFNRLQVLDGHPAVEVFPHLEEKVEKRGRFSKKGPAVFHRKIWTRIFAGKENPNRTAA